MTLLKKRTNKAKSTQNTCPQVQINSWNLSNNTWSSDGLVWSIPKLIQYVNEENLPVFDLPLAAIDLQHMPWKMDTVKDFLTHAEKTNKADLQYPIILDDWGFICDGWHRVSKAILEGRTTIKAVRIQKMPVHSGVTEE